MITGVPRWAANVTGAPPPSAGNENDGAAVPGFKVAGGGDSSAAVPPDVGADGPRTTTNTTNPTRPAPATRAIHLKTRSVRPGRRPEAPAVTAVLPARMSAVPPHSSWSG